MAFLITARTTSDAEMKLGISHAACETHQNKMRCYNLNNSLTGVVPKSGLGHVDLQND